jgi:hypothetical protein
MDSLSPRKVRALPAIALVLQNECNSTSAKRPCGGVSGGAAVKTLDKAARRHPQHGFSQKIG